jgi:hypothetical protein
MTGKSRRSTGRSSVDRAAAKAWVEGWKAAGARLQDLRRRRLQSLTTREVQQAMVAFDGAFKAIQRRRKGRRSSGLVEMQAWFRRMRK